MVRGEKLFGALALSGLVLLMAAPGANALTMSECSAKYKSAKSAGTLKGQGWNDFRKAECGAAAAATAPANDAAKSSAAVAAKSDSSKPAVTTAAASSAATGTAAKYPAAVDAKYAGEKAAKARMKTCVDQYNANKTANANGGLKWIQKGGGYYSLCNKRLKGAV